MSFIRPEISRASIRWFETATYAAVTILILWWLSGAAVDVYWRGGLMLVASYSFFRGARLVLENMDLPTQLEVGFGLALAGAAMVMLSLVVERMQDAKEEDLRE